MFQTASSKTGGEDEFRRPIWPDIRSALHYGGSSGIQPKSVRPVSALRAVGVRLDGSVRQLTQTFFSNARCLKSAWESRSHAASTPREYGLAPP